MRRYRTCVRVLRMEFLPAVRTPNPLPSLLRNRDVVGLALGAATAYTAKQAWDAHAAVKAAPSTADAAAAAKVRNTWALISAAGLAGTLFIMDKGSIANYARRRF